MMAAVKAIVIMIRMKEYGHPTEPPMVPAGKPGPGEPGYQTQATTYVYIYIYII